jgi:hypothetical protein
LWQWIGTPERRTLLKLSCASMPRVE